MMNSASAAAGFNALFAEAPAAFRAEINAKLDAEAANKRTSLVEDAALISSRNEDLEAAIRTYRSQFLPKGAHEEMLVRELAVADWRLQLITKIEACMLWAQAQYVYESELRGSDLSKLDEKTTSLVLSLAWFRFSGAFSLLIRYQNSTRRAYYRALKQLELVRTGKAGYLPPKETAKTAAPTPQPEKSNQAPSKPAAAQTNPTTAPFTNTAQYQTNPNPRATSFTPPPGTAPSNSPTSQIENGV